MGDFDYKIHIDRLSKFADLANTYYSLRNTVDLPIDVKIVVIQLYKTGDLDNITIAIEIMKTYDKS